MPRKTIDNDGNNDTLSNRKEEKDSLLVRNKQPEEQLPIGQDFETEVLEEKDEEQTSTVPIKEEESGISRKKKQKQRKKKRSIKPTARMAETDHVADLKRQLAKQTSNIDQITKILKPLQKYIITTERQFKSVKQIEVQIKQLQKQTSDILKAIRKIK
ncbi:MAG TPA: hypothetical protein VH796_11080 [Nitrososphaeraceae archaeon]|jgi:hypothetical protein